MQLAKNVFGGGKVITTPSTGQIAIVKGLLGRGTPDQIIAYTKEDIRKVFGKQEVFMFDPVQGTLAALPLIKNGGWIISVSTVRSRTTR